MFRITPQHNMKTDKRLLSKPQFGDIRKERVSLPCGAVAGGDVSVEIAPEQLQGAEQRRPRHVDEAAKALALIECDEARDLVEGGGGRLALAHFVERHRER